MATIQHAFKSGFLHEFGQHFGPNCLHFQHLNVFIMHSIFCLFRCGCAGEILQFSLLPSRMSPVLLPSLNVPQCGISTNGRPSRCTSDSAWRRECGNDDANKDHTWLRVAWPVDVRAQLMHSSEFTSHVHAHCFKHCLLADMSLFFSLPRPIQQHRIL